MTIASPFQPKKGANQKVTASTASASIGIAAGSKSLRVCNSGAVVGYFRTFKSSDNTLNDNVATTGDTPVLPASAASSTLVIEKPQDHDSVAYISDSATTVLHFQPGEGGS